MINNLIGKGNLNHKTDLCIIGGGTAGLLVGSLLAEKGFKVLILESGDMTQDNEIHELNQTIYTKNIYNSSNIGRFRCLGGTSTRWGAGMLPFTINDFEEGKWPIKFNEINKYLIEIEKYFKLNDGSYLFKEKLNSINKDFILKYAKLPSFKNRNVYNIFKSTLHENKNLDIWLNSTVTKFKVEKNVLNNIVAESHDGSYINIEANNYLITAGAIESTRLMLLLDKQNEFCVSKFSPSLGKFFCDHVSIPVSEIIPKNINKLNKIFGYHFEKNKNMKNIRFEMSETSSIRKSLPPFFARIVFGDMNGGYENLRNFFREIQKKKLPSFSNFFGIIRSLPWILKAVKWRFLDKRLLFPKNPALEANIIMEQESINSNKIFLSDTKKDFYDQPIATIEWSVTKNDANNILKAASYLKNFWDNSILNDYGIFKMKSRSIIENHIKNADGIHHPSGSTRMGKSKEEGVVDSDLNVFLINNLKILSTSVFPSGGGANPTMTLLMLGLRFVDQFLGKNNKK